MNLGEYMMAGAEGKKMKLSNLILMIKGKRIEKNERIHTHTHKQISTKHIEMERSGK